MSGFPGKSLTCSRNRYPSRWASRRTTISGLVFLLPTARIIAERWVGVRVSAMIFIMRECWELRKVVRGAAAMAATRKTAASCTEGRAVQAKEKAGRCTRPFLLRCKARTQFAPLAAGPAWATLVTVGAAAICVASVSRCALKFASSRPSSLRPVGTLRAIGFIFLPFRCTS